MPAFDTRIHFSDRVQVHFDGTPIDLPGRRPDWLEFAFDGDLSMLKPSVYGGGERVVSVVTKGFLTVRVLATSGFIRDTLPMLIDRMETQGYFSITLHDENRDSRIVIITDFGGVVRQPTIKRGAPELEEVEVMFDGFWYITR